MSAPMLDPTIDRFRVDCCALLPCPPDIGRPLGIAVSGGADSMALLALAAAAFPGAVVAATVDHRLRREAADEAALVARWCPGEGIPHTALVADVAIAGGGVQAQAREMRYRLLGAWAAEQAAVAVATAHHADDQAETFLMRAVRGSGLAGLRGIPARSMIAGMTVVRPLLHWRRAELRALVEAAAIPFVEDPSNADPAYERVRVRALLAETDWSPGLAASARYLAEVDADVAAMHDWLWRERTIAAEPSELAIDLADLPREWRRRLARTAIEAVRAACAIGAPAFSAATNIEALLDRLDTGETAVHGGVIVRPVGMVWSFAKAPTRRSS